VEHSMIAEGCEICGTVTGSVISTGCTVEEGAKVVDTVVMPGAVIKKGAVVERTILGEDCVIGENCVIGGPEGGISLIGPGATIPAGTVVAAGLQVDDDSIPGKEAK